MEEQVVGQPPVNKKKSLEVAAVPSAGLQSDALGGTAVPTPAPSPIPTPHPGTGFFADLAKRGLYVPATGAFQGLGALAALNHEMNRRGGRVAVEKDAPWLLDAILAQRDGTPYAIGKKGKDTVKNSRGIPAGTRDTLKLPE